MRASVHGYTRAWKQTGATGRLATTAARLPPAESPPTASERVAAEVGGVVVRPGASPSWRRRRAAGNGCSGASR